VAQMKKDNVSSFGIIEGDDATGHGGASALQDAAKQFGLKVTGTVFVPDTAVDATAQVQQLRASNPQAIAIVGFTPANPPVFAARSKLGWNVPVYLDPSAAAVNLGSFTTAAERKGLKLGGFPYFVKGSPAASTPAYKSFLTNIYKFEPHPPISMLGSMVTWDVLMLARAAAEKSHSIDGPAMVAAMNHITNSSQVPGYVGGTRLYSPTSHIWQWRPSDYTFLPPGVLVNGELVPDPA
jgi:branched-chain amino acid transport system substrate-binding protein